MSEILQKISSRTKDIKDDINFIKTFFDFDNFINCDIDKKRRFLNIFNLNEKDYGITIFVDYNNKSYIKFSEKMNIKNKLLMSLNENDLYFSIYTENNEKINGIENFDNVVIS